MHQDFDAAVILHVVIMSVLLFDQEGCFPLFLKTDAHRENLSQIQDQFALWLLATVAGR